MIKEIEVGGVKHSITLADDMVGSGLQKDTGGCVSLNVLQVPAGSDVVSGLTFTGGALCLDKRVLATSLAGSGLYIVDNKLVVSGGPSADTLCGSGLVVYNDRLNISTDIAGTGLKIGYGNVLEVLINTNSGLAFESSTKKMIIKLAQRGSGLRLFFNEKGQLDVTQD